MDPRTSHIASVNRMMAQALELQDKVAALAVTAPVTSSPRTVPHRAPAAASLAAAFQLDLRTPRLMMTRSLPTSFDAILAQYGEDMMILSLTFKSQSRHISSLK